MMPQLLKVLLVLAPVVASINNIDNEFVIDKTMGAFNHLAIHKETGQLYIGAVNRIYSLNKNLDIIQETVTGKEMDNPDCMKRFVHCNLPQTEMNSYNKALVIDYQNNKLIACSTLYHGVCDKYDLDNIKLRDENRINLAIVANNAKATTFIFIAPGPVIDSNWHPENALYAGASYTNTGSYYVRDRVPAFSSRNLNDFEFSIKDFGFSTAIKFEPQLRQSFPVYYQYGFGSEGFSYMITVQKNDPSSEAYISKMFRVCQKDRQFYSYAEVQLQCISNDIHYNLAQAAYLGKAGNTLAQSMGIPDTEDVLYVVFSASTPNTATPTNNSALCVYPMRTVRRKFTENIRYCFKGIGNTGPAHIRMPLTCTKMPELEHLIDDKYCGQYEVNNPIDGSMPIRTHAAVTFNSTVSAVTVTMFSGYTVAIVGMTNGHLVKVALEKEEVGSVYEDVALTEGSKIHADMYVDIDGQHVYVMTDWKLLKVKLYDCSQSSNCLGANDPFCGWCSLENKMYDNSTAMKALGISQICYAVILRITHQTAKCSGCQSTISKCAPDNNTYDICLECCAGYLLRNDRCEPCPKECLTCTNQPTDNITSIATCTNCSDGYFEGKADDKDITDRFSKAHQKELFGSLDDKSTRSGIMCYECSLKFEGCTRCNWNDFFNLTCTSCKEGYIVVSNDSIDQIGKCQECSKFIDNCEQCEWIDKLEGVACTSCMDGYFSRSLDQIGKCQKCSKFIDNCEQCEWIEKLGDVACTSCKEGYFSISCDPSSLWNISTIGAVVIGTIIALLTYAAGVWRLSRIVRRRTDDRRKNVPTTKCDKARMNTIFMAGLVTVVVPLALGIYEFTNWLRKKCDRRQAVPPIEDVMSLSGKDQNDESEPVTRRESIKMSLLNENGEDELKYIGGNIAFFPEKTLGHGSSAVVYEGRFGRLNPKPVAVKIIKRFNEQDAEETQTEIKNIYREILNMETLNKSKSPNVIEFIDSVIDKKTVYIAFELAKGTLHDYVDSSNVSWQVALPGATVTREIIDGLHYTHQKKIVHRDLKPANIFIVENSGTGLKAAIGDYGTAKVTTGSMFSLTGKMGSLGYIAPEIWRALKEKPDAFGSQCSTQSDIFSLGLVIYFALSLGKHPYGNEMTAQVEIEKASFPTFEQIDSQVNAYAFIHMLRPMFNDNPTERPMVEKISEHPALMSAYKVMEFFVNKSDEFENLIKADPLKTNLLEDTSLVKNQNWMKQLPVHLQTYLRSYKLKNRSNPLYQGKETSIRYLIRAVRNTKAHHTEYPKDAQTELGVFPEGHVELWLNVCPRLFMHVYDKLGPP